MRQIIYTRRALESLDRIPTNVGRRIRSKIVQYASDPRSLSNNVLKLQRRAGFRLRVGDWRVIFDDNGIVIDVLEIGPRGGVYDRD